MATDRRRFLTMAGAATVYQLVTPAPRQVKAASGDEISLGFIGSGIRGKELIDGFKAAGGNRMLAVADLYDGCLQRVKEQISPDVATTKEYREVLDRKDIDAVVIATPDHWHKRLVLEALAAGKHVYVEKPMTWSLEEGPEIIAAEKKSGKVLQVGSQHKTDMMTAKTKELVASGVLGKVNMVRLSNNRNNAQGAWKYPVPQDASPATVDWERFLGDRKKRPFDPKVFFEWRCWWEFSGGVATDLFVHLLTWLHEVMGVQAPVAVSSYGALIKWKDGRDVPDVLNSLFEYKEGFVADAYVNLANAFPRVMGNTIMGDQATLYEEGNHLILYPEAPDPIVQSYGSSSWPQAAREAYFVKNGWLASGRPAQRPEPIQPKTIDIEAGPSHQEVFLTSVREGKPSRENATEGHYAAGAAHLANMAYKQGKRMKWDHATNKVSS